MNRNPLRSIGLIVIGFISTLGLTMGANVYASSLSIEEILEQFLDAIVNYVAGDAIEKIKDTLDWFKKNMEGLYGGDSEDVAKQAAAVGKGYDKIIEVEEMIYNQRAMSDAHNILIACRPPIGPTVVSTEAAIDTLNVNLQTKAATITKRQLQQGEFARRARENLAALRSNPNELPPAADATLFLIDCGYADQAEADAAYRYLSAITDVARANAISNSTKVTEFNPSVESSFHSNLEVLAEIMAATSALNDCYLARVRDKSLATKTVGLMTEREMAILKLHSNEAGMSLVDLQNLEADLTAHNSDTVKDIMGSVDADTAPAIPTTVRAYKYLINAKATSNAFTDRLNRQGETIAKLTAILAKQSIRRRMD